MITFSFTDIRPATEVVRRLASNYPNAAAVAMREIAKETVEDIKSRTPVRQWPPGPRGASKFRGYLRSRTRSKLIGRGKGVTGFVIHNDAPYAQYVEYLHPTKPGFFRIPIESLKRTFTSRLARKIRAQIRTNR